MSKQKERKRELGTHRSTENRASNSDENGVVNYWLQKVRDAERYQSGDGVHSGINRVADVLVELIKQIKDGKVEREVITKLSQRQNIQASLVVAQRKLGVR